MYACPYSSTLCNKTTTVTDFLAQMRKKYPKYQEVYFFGMGKG